MTAAASGTCSAATNGATSWDAVNGTAASYYLSDSVHKAELDFKNKSGQAILAGQWIAKLDITVTAEELK